MKTFKQFMAEQDDNLNKHLGSSDDEISKKLHSDNKNITREHEQAVKDHSFVSRHINSYLMQTDRKLEPKKEEHIKNMDDMIKKNPIQHHLNVYSGISWDPRNKLDDSGHLYMPAYTSTTHNRDLANDFSFDKSKDLTSHLMHIHLKSGDPATHISKLSSVGGEKETIIGRDNKFKHLKTDIEKYRGSGGQIMTQHVHHFEIVKGNN